jgi:VanZ family protein
VKKLKRFSWYSLPALAWFLLCTILLTIPGSKLPKEDWLDNIWMFDKWIHIGLFGILAFLAGRAYYQNISFTQRTSFIIICGILCLAYGILMEFDQKYFIPNRSFDLGDITADGIGSFLGAWFSARVYIKK